MAGKRKMFLLTQSLWLSNLSYCLSKVKIRKEHSSYYRGSAFRAGFERRKLYCRTCDKLLLPGDIVYSVGHLSGGRVALRHLLCSIRINLLVQNFIIELE